MKTYFGLKHETRESKGLKFADSDMIGKNRRHKSNYKNTSGKKEVGIDEFKSQAMSPEVDVDTSLTVDNIIDEVNKDKCKEKRGNGEK